MTTASPTPRTSAGYQVFMLALCLYALIALSLQVLAPLDAESLAILGYADTAVCVVFLADFALSLWRAENRWHYLYTWGWLDLASSIPMLDVARWGRVARIARIFRVLRGVRATKTLAGLILERRAQNTFLAVSLVAILLTVVASISVLQFETAANANIKTAEDAIWWAFATVTTVGYGDHYPVTTEGRFVAVVLMCVGVGLFGTLSAFLAAWFISPGAKGERGELEALRLEVAEIRTLLEGGDARPDRRSTLRAGLAEPD